MDKTLTKRIDALVVGCALGSGCDEHELMHLAIEYAHEFRRPYVLPYKHMRSLETHNNERDVAKRMEATVNEVIDKTLTKRIDALVVGCALGSRRDDEAELMHLATEYARGFRRPYVLPSTHMRSLETPIEQETAIQMESKVNDVINKTIRPHTPRTRSNGGRKRSRSSKRRL
jgi:NAD(P)H-hydrate repair Nnr-like enzyme with NAD(P)H-hydrate dehydratase domain